MAKLRARLRFDFQGTTIVAFIVKEAIWLTFSEIPVRGQDTGEQGVCVLVLLSSKATRDGDDSQR